MFHGRTMVHARAAAVLAVSGCLVAACGDRGGLSYTPDQYAARGHDLACTHAVSCGSLPDEASCPTHADDKQLKADIASGKTKYDGVAASACLDVVALRDCSFSTIYTQDPTCERVATGTVADGGDCS